MTETSEPKRISLKSNYIFNLLFQVFSVLSPLITAPYLSRVLTPDGVGMQGFTTATVYYFVLFGTLGISSYGQREIARLRENKNQYSKSFWEIFISKNITLLISTLAYGIFIMINSSSEYFWLYVVQISTLLATFLDINFFFEGHEAFKPLAIRGIIAKVLGIVMVFVFVKDENDVWIAILSMNVPNILTYLWMWTTLPRYLVKVNLKGMKLFTHMKSLIIYFVPALASQIFSYADKTIIKLVTNSDAEVGYYEQAEKTIKIGMSIITSFNVIMQSRVSYLFETNELDKVKNYIMKSFNLLFFLAIPITFGYIIIADNFVTWFFGELFTPSIVLIYVFAPLGLIIGISALIKTHYFTPSGKQMQGNIVLIIGIVLNIGLNFIAVYLWQTIGAVIVTIITELYVAIAYLIMARKMINFKKVLILFCKYLVGALIMFVSLYFISIILPGTILKTVLQIIIGFTIYAVFLLIIKDEFIISVIRQGADFIRKLFAKGSNNDE